MWRASTALALTLLVFGATFVVASQRSSAGQPLYGDASRDERVNGIDSTLVLQADAGLITSVPCEENADVNDDSRVNSLDSTLILQFDAGLIREIGPGVATVTPRPTRTPTRRPPTPERTPTQTNNCHPSYVGVCLDPSAVDYDCEGGSGNGPLYVDGPFSVVGDDKFGLDADSDGVGCEN